MKWAERVVVGKTLTPFYVPHKKILADLVEAYVGAFRELYGQEEGDKVANTWVRQKFGRVMNATHSTVIQEFKRKEETVRKIKAEKKARKFCVIENLNKNLKSNCSDLAMVAT